MFIKYLDYLSPKVTFYHKGTLSHSSILSGIISIIAIIFVIMLAVYYFLEIIERRNPNVSYFKSFEEDSGEFQINTSSLFHFVSIAQVYRGITTMEEIDFTSFNMIGAQMYTESFLGTFKKTGVKHFDHWLYGYCDQETNTQGLDDLIIYDYFNKSACIKKYYNSTEKQYYDIGDPKFIWPEIAHGTFNDSNILYGLYIIKCENSIINNILGDDYQCKNDSEFGQYLSGKKGSKVFHFNFINTFINALDYNSPINNFFYRIESTIHEVQYTTNNLNFNPAVIKTNNGLVLDKLKQDISYIFERNDAYIEDKGGYTIYMGYVFFLKNIMEYYQRSYRKIQDVISNIGGINQAITIIAIMINNLYNHYVVLYDTETLLHSTIYFEKEIHRKQSIQYRQLKLKEVEVENKNKKKRLSERKKSNKINIDIPEYKANINNNNFAKRNNNNFINIRKKNDKYSLDSNIKILENNDKNIIKENNNIKDNTKKEKKDKKSFCNFLSFKISCGKKMECFKIYENFRMKIISEEHIIRNHLNIYNLLKATEKKRNIMKSTYHINDLLQLI